MTTATVGTIIRPREEIVEPVSWVVFALSAEAHRKLIECGYILVTSHLNPERVYKVPLLPEPVHVYERARAVEDLRLNLAGPERREDVVAMHKMLLETCEDAYLTHAEHIRLA